MTRSVVRKPKLTLVLFAIWLFCGQLASFPCCAQQQSPVFGQSSIPARIAPFPFGSISPISRADDLPLGKHRKNDIEFESFSSVPRLLTGSINSTNDRGKADPAVQPAAFEEPIAEVVPTQQEDTGNFIDLGEWLDKIEVGYDQGFQIASKEQVDLGSSDDKFLLQVNGWGQLRNTLFESESGLRDLRQFQLKRARIALSGNAFTPDFKYFFQIDGRSSDGDTLRLLDYYLSYDFGHHSLGLDSKVLAFRTGRWKMPFNLSRNLSGREFEFSDRSVSSLFFDVNRSLAWGLYGVSDNSFAPIDWEVAVFNGLVTGGAQTGSSGTLDTNFAYSGRAFCVPVGEWGKGQLADLDYHESLAVRMGLGVANSTIERIGTTEFDSVRVVDSGDRLSDILPGPVDSYRVMLYSADLSCKYQGWSITNEYYFRVIDNFRGASLPKLFDHGHWLQVGKFIVPSKLQVLSRWSRVDGGSGTLGNGDQSSDEVAGGFAYYFRGQNSKIVVEATHINGSPISSAALDLQPGDRGWFIRTQIQFAF